MARNIEFESRINTSLVSGVDISVKDNLGVVVASGVTGPSGSVTLTINSGSYIAYADYTDPSSKAYHGSTSFTATMLGPDIVAIELIAV